MSPPPDISEKDATIPIRAGARLEDIGQIDHAACNGEKCYQNDTGVLLCRLLREHDLRLEVRSPRLSLGL